MDELVIAKKNDLVDIADAIRSKTETSDTLALDEMPQMIMDIESGLNLAVIGGTTQPTGTENMVWVNTDTEISGWAFSADEPSSPAEGMLWFVTGASSTAAINVDNKNTVMIYPSGCYQYIGGAWIKKTAQTYLNGAWVAWKLIIYEEGYINTDAIGSFISVGKQASSTNGGTASAPTVVYNTDNILMYTGNSYKGGIVHTELPIDLTGFSTVNVRATESGGYAPSLKIYSAIGSYQDSNVAATVSIAKGTTGTYSVDVSALTGEYYIGLAMLGDSGTGVTLNVYNLWCE